MDGVKLQGTVSLILLLLLEAGARLVKRDLMLLLKITLEQGEALLTKKWIENVTPLQAHPLYHVGGLLKHTEAFLQ